MVGRTRYRLPLNGSLERKFARPRGAPRPARPRGSAARRHRPATGPSPSSAARRSRRSTAPLFYGSLSVCASRESCGARLRTRSSRRARTRRSRPSPGEGWRGATPPSSSRSTATGATWSRLYGSPRACRGRAARRSARLGRGPQRRRRADALALHHRNRPRAPASSRQVSSPTYTELDRLLGAAGRAASRASVALFVGVLERYKNVHAIAEAWRLAASRVPDATLRIVGDGRHRDVAEALVRDLPGRVTWERRLETRRRREGVRRRLGLLLPPRARRGRRGSCSRRSAAAGPSSARAPAASRTSSTDGETGFLVDPDRPEEIADALVRILSDRSPRRASRRGRPGALGRLDVHARGVRRPRGRARRNARSRRAAHEARRRHPAGRPGEPGARARRSTSSARWQPASTSSS